MRMIETIPGKTLSIVLLCLLFSLPAVAGDWPFWRGPRGDGTSAESGLPRTWSPRGENLAWRAPYGARSAPIVLNGRVYLQNTAGQGETQQERVMCFDADSGEVLWEHRFNVYLSDVPSHRVGWPSPTADPATGNIHVFGVGGLLIALTRDGDVLWERSLGEEFGLITTHGGRTVSPVVVDDLVIVSGLTSGWGEQARGAHRFFAFDKASGDLVWASSPGERPYDTTYAPPIVRVIDDIPQLIVGGSDGAVHGLKVGTGQPLWRYAISKRGLNSGAVLKGNTVFVSHSEENLETSVMGRITAFDATAKGELGQDQVKWEVNGFTAGFPSPVLDDDCLYQIDNGANLAAWDLATGTQLWTRSLGTIQKASPVLADGKLYVGTENGTFYIIEPSREGSRILSEVEMGSPAEPEPIIGSAAVAQGRIYLATGRAVYAIGNPAQDASASVSSGSSASPTDLLLSEGVGPVEALLVVPAERVAEPGESISFQVRFFDGRGRRLQKFEGVSWELKGLAGQLSQNGTFTPAADRGPQAGTIEATFQGVRGSARVRVIPPLPWKEDFEGISGDRVPSHWINATGKYAIRELEGQKVLVKLADNPFTRRARTFMGPSDWSDYTVEVDVRARRERRQMGDAGVVAQRYALVLFGNHQRLELQPWQPETERTVTVPFTWAPDRWYRLKLRVENLEDGRTRTSGKAWPIDQNEPQDWLIQRTDPIPNRSGSPGIYADAAFEIFFDNLEVRQHQ